MKIVIDYDDLTKTYISTIGSRSPLSKKVKGVGDTIEESVDNLIKLLDIVEYGYSNDDKIKNTIFGWIKNLRLVGKVKVKFTRPLIKEVYSSIRSEVIKSLIKNHH